MELVGLTAQWVGPGLLALPLVAPEPEIDNEPTEALVNSAERPEQD